MTGACKILLQHWLLLQHIFDVPLSKIKGGQKIKLHGFCKNRLPVERLERRFDADTRYTESRINIFSDCLHRISGRMITWNSRLCSPLITHPQLWHLATIFLINKEAVSTLSMEWMMGEQITGGGLDNVWCATFILIFLKIPLKMKHSL